MNNEQSKENINALYGLRFVIISLLIVYHMGYPINTGVLSVTFFFILSGFVIGYSSQQKNMVYNLKNTLLFYRKRLKKIYPLYLLTTGLGIISMIYFYHVEFSLNELLLHLLMIKTWVPVNIDKTSWFGGAIWYMSTLWFCYLATPAIYRGGVYIKRRFNSENSLPVIVAGIYVLYFLGILEIKEVSETLIGWLLYYSPLRIIDYSIGMLCGMYYASKKKRIWKNHRIQNMAQVFLELLSIVILIEVERHTDMIRSSFVNDVCWIIPCQLLIWVYAQGGGTFSKILASKPFVYLGKLNYPMLCCHQVLFDFIAWCLGGQCLYSKEIGCLEYVRTLFLFGLILCVSDVLNRTICSQKFCKN